MVGFDLINMFDLEFPPFCSCFVYSSGISFSLPSIIFHPVFIPPPFIHFSFGRLFICSLIFYSGDMTVTLAISSAQEPKIFLFDAKGTGTILSCLSLHTSPVVQIQVIIELFYNGGWE